MEANRKVWKYYVHYIEADDVEYFEFHFKVSQDWDESSAFVFVTS